MIRSCYILVLVAAAMMLPWAIAAADGGVRTVRGEYRYYVPRHVSRDQAEQTALQRAMIEAMARNFGTVVSHSTKMDMRSSKSGESTDFYSSASSLVKGEWLETIGAPKFGIELEGDDIVVTCEVEGRAREITRANARLEARILRNTADGDAESGYFQDGDKCLLAFTSPIDGYLSVYLEGEDKNLYRMLPFYNQRATTYRIEADKPYLFFGSQEGDEEQYVLQTDGHTEHNTVYIIFSPNEFIKPIERSSTEPNSLRQLPSADFMKWLADARALDPQLQVITRTLTISEREE